LRAQCKTRPVESILAELRSFAAYYAAFGWASEQEEELREALRRVRSLVEVASPLVLQLYEYYADAKTLSLAGFIEACELIESYVFRRTVCAMQTRSLYQIFSSIAYRVDKSDPLTNLKVILHTQPRKRRFPSDTEFREALETRDVYSAITCWTG
jgi:hypothetical protein